MFQRRHDWTWLSEFSGVAVLYVWGGGGGGVREAGWKHE